MRRRKTLSFLIGLIVSGCASEPLYLTSPHKFTDDRYQYIMPYFPAVTTQVTVQIAPPAPATSPGSGTPAPAACPPAAPPACPPAPAGPAPAATPKLPTITLTVTPVPTARAYIYMTKNSLFDSVANVSTDATGLLSSSNSSSVQEVTASLAEIAQTVAAASRYKVDFNLNGVRLPATPTPAQACTALVGSIISKATQYPYISTFRLNKDATSYPLDAERAPLDTAWLTVDFDIPLVNDSADPYNGTAHEGLAAFYPVPAFATLNCTAESHKHNKTTEQKIALSPPLAVNLYLYSDFVYPNRDFLTGPADTYTFSSGFLTGHKYSEQSAAKTVVDTVTTPVRALMPSVSVQQTTQIQTGGGKPAQYETQTQTTTGAPKSGSN